MPAPLEPPALDALVDLAERSRVDDWSLRSALCRYAQPEPARVATVLSLVRRWDAAVHDHLKLLRRDGSRLLDAAQGDGTVEDGTEAAEVVGLLRVGADLDRLGDLAAEWARDRHGPDPAAAIDEAAARVAVALEELGVPDEAPIPPGMRGRG
ncbi:MAG: hypothetical protein KF906_02280 [Actinobacteria bacterium]|nr:hypothetical protein [Actinomycetota bacterium]